jgi:hypothetical protein
MALRFCNDKVLLVALLKHLNQVSASLFVTFSKFYKQLQGVVVSFQFFLWVAQNMLQRRAVIVRVDCPAAESEESREKNENCSDHPGQ